jgi:hypothetical protein
LGAEVGPQSVTDDGNIERLSHAAQLFDHARLKELCLINQNTVVALQGIKIEDRLPTHEQISLLHEPGPRANLNLTEASIEARFDQKDAFFLLPIGMGHG